MSTDIATLGVKVDTTQVRGAAKDFRQLQAAGASLETQVEHLLAPLRQLQNLLASIASVVAIHKLIEYADSWKQIESRLKLVTRTTQELLLLQDKLFSSTQRTRTEFSATAELYTKLARSTSSLGANGSQLLAVTETVNKAVAISGTSAASAAAGIFQFSQAMASGSLRGDELNSILENMPRLAEAIAAGMGKTVGQLRTLGAEGKLTATQVVEAILSQTSVIDAEFGKMAVTVSQAWTTVENAVLRYVGRTDSALGATKALADGLTAVAENFDEVASAVGAAAAAIGAAAAVNVAGRALQGAGSSVAKVRTEVAANAAAAAATLEKARADQAAAATALAYAKAEHSLQAALSGTLAAELKIEQQRYAAQITEQGRIARQQQMFAATTALTTANRALIASEMALVEANAAATTTTVAVANAQAAAAVSTSALATMTGVLTAAWTKAVAAFRAIIALMGGPWIAALTVLGGAFYYLATRQTEAEKVAEKYADAYERTGKKLDQFRGKLGELERQQDKTNKATSKLLLQEAEAAIDVALKSFGTDAVLGFVDSIRVGQAAITDIEQAQASFMATGAQDIAALEDALIGIAEKYEGAKKPILDWLKTHKKAYYGAKGAVVELKEEVTGLSSEQLKLVNTAAVAKTAMSSVAQELGYVYENGRLVSERQSQLEATTAKLTKILALTDEELNSIGGRKQVLWLLDQAKLKFDSTAQAVKNLNDQFRALQASAGYARRVVELMTEWESKNPQPQLQSTSEAGATALANDAHVRARTAAEADAAMRAALEGRNAAEQARQAAIDDAVTKRYLAAAQQRGEAAAIEMQARVGLIDVIRRQQVVTQEDIEGFLKAGNAAEWLGRNVSNSAGIIEAYNSTVAGDMAEHNAAIAKSAADAANATTGAMKAAQGAAEAYQESEAKGMAFAVLLEKLNEANENQYGAAWAYSEALKQVQTDYANIVASQEQYVVSLDHQVSQAHALAIAAGEGAVAEEQAANAIAASEQVRVKELSLLQQKVILAEAVKAKVISQADAAAQIAVIQAQINGLGEEELAIRERLDKLSGEQTLKSLREYTYSKQQQIIVLQAEASLLLASEATRERELALLQLKLDYEQRIAAAHEDQKIGLQEEYANAVKVTNEYYDTKRAVESVTAEVEMWKHAGEGIIDSFADFFATVREDGESAFESLADSILDVFQQLQKDLIKNQLSAVVNVLFNTSTSSTTSGSTVSAAGTATSASSGSFSLSNLLGGNSSGSSVLGKSLYSLSDIFGSGSSSTTSSISVPVAALDDVSTGWTGATTANTAYIADYGAVAGAGDYGTITSSGSITSSSSGSFLSGINVDVLGSAVGGIAASLIGDMVFEWETDAGEIGSSIGSTIGSTIGTAILPGIGTFFGSLAGDFLGGTLGDLFGDVQTPRGGAGLAISESGSIQVGATWGLDGAEEQDFIDAADSLSSLINTVLDAMDARLTASLGSNLAFGYDEDSEGFYYAPNFVDSSNLGEGAQTGFETIEEAAIAMITELLNTGVDDLPANVQTALNTIQTDDLEYYGELLVLAASWEDLIETLRTGTIDYTESIQATAEEINDTYREEIQTLQDMAADSGMAVNELNLAYEQAILRYLGLAEEGEEAFTDAQYAYMLAYEQIAGATDLLEQIGYSAEAAAEVIAEALEVLQADSITEFEAGITEAMNSLKGLDILNSFQGYIDSYADDQAFAEMIGADLDYLDELWSLTIQSILDSSGEMGTAVEELTKAFPDFTDAIYEAYTAVVDTTDLLASVYSTLGRDLDASLLTYDAETEAGRGQYTGAELLLYESQRAAERAQLVYDSYVEMAEEQIDSTEDLIDSNADLIDALYSLQDTAASLRLDESLSPGSLLDLLTEAETQYQDALSRAYDTSLPADDRLEAIDQVNDLVGTYLDYAQQYYASSEAYAEIFARVQEELLGLSGEQIAELEVQTATLRDELDALTAIQDSIDTAAAAADLSADELQALISTASADLTTALTALTSTLASYEAGTLYTPETTTTTTTTTEGTAYEPGYIEAGAIGAGIQAEGARVRDATQAMADQVAAEGARIRDAVAHNTAQAATTATVANDATDAEALDWFSWTASGSAHGNVFGTSLTNGIYDNVTPFLFSQGGAFGQLGVLGEAGPEAVLPLMRGPNGDLGVQFFADGHEYFNFAANDRYPENVAPIHAERSAPELRAMHRELKKTREVIKQQNKLIDRLARMLSDQNSEQRGLLEEIAGTNAEMADGQRRRVA